MGVPDRNRTGDRRRGRLRISGSLRNVLRNKWLEGWVGNDFGRRIWFVLSLLTMAAFLPRVAASVRAVLAGDLVSRQLLTLAAFGFVVLLAAWRATRSRSIPLRDVEVVRREDDEWVRVEVADGDGTETVELRLLTADDADEAVEILRLKGARVERDRDDPAED